MSHVSYRPLLVIYENDHTSPNLEKLITSMKILNYDYVILGSGDKWLGFGTKIKAYHDYFKTLDPERIVIQLDSRDVLAVNYDVQHLTKKLSNEYAEILEDKIIISAEAHIIIGASFTNKPFSLIDKHTLKRKRRTHDLSFTVHHRPEWTNIFNKMDKINKINKINSGMILGKAKNFIKIYDIVDIDYPEDDQLMLYELYFIKPELFLIDSNNIFFKNYIHTSKLDKYYGDVPCCYFIQTPGKYWYAYNEIYEKITRKFINSVIHRS